MSKPVVSPTPQRKQVPDLAMPSALLLTGALFLSFVIIETNGVFKVTIIGGLLAAFLEFIFFVPIGAALFMVGLVLLVKRFVQKKLQG